jgi:transposase InsO family protein
VEIHGNAGLLPRQRALMCRRVREEGWTVAAAAEAAGVSERTTYRWLKRWDAGEAMTDGSSAPRRRPRRTSRQVEQLIERLRRCRKTSTQIAAELAMPTSTVCAVLKRLELNRLWRLEPPEPPNRYCRRHPGELIHVDVKKLGRFDFPGHRVTGRGPGTYRNRTRSRRVGWEFVHVAIDDTSRLAYVEILDDERGASCVAFLRRAIGFFAAHGITVQAVMTDNGTGYRAKVHRAGVAALGIRHHRTQPYRPRTNGKAERFIQTLQREWAYAAAYPSSWHRRQALLPWLRYYNCRRPHSALGHKTPISQIG